MKQAVLSAVLVLLPAPGLASGAVRYVPADYPTIQQAIDDCNDGLLNFADYAEIASAVPGVAAFGRLAAAAKRWLEMTSWCEYPFDPPGPATQPVPPDGSRYYGRSPLLSWTAGEGATSHDVYFGTARPPVFRVNQTATTYSPGLLEEDMTFYWRIDEVNRYGVATGPTWSFTTRGGGR